MRIAIDIATGNQAFADGNRDAEVQRILTGILMKIRHGDDGGLCIDSNGNKVGSWDLYLSPCEENAEE